MNETLQNIQNSLGHLFPEIVLFLGIAGLTLWVSFIPKPVSTPNFRAVLLITISIVTLSLLLVYNRWCNLDVEQSLFLESLILSKQTVLFHGFILLGSLLSLLHVVVTGYKASAEYFILFLAIVLGALLLAASSNFMSMFVSLELVSICSYVLIAIERKAKNYESSIKYLTIGAIISAVMLYGISLIYGLTGTLSFAGILAFNSQALFYVVLLMTMAGLLFKLSASPFHIWAPDVYETAPLPVLSFLSVVPKIAAFLVILKLAAINSPELTQVLAVIVLITVSIGNFAALRQKDAKRMMAYSGIAHAGFILIGLLNINGGGTEASLFYLGIYVFMNVAAFLLVDLLQKASGSTLLESFSGLGSQRILLGGITILVMISLVGIPPSAGFTAKFLIFSSLIPQIQAGQTLALVVLIFGVLNTAIALFYYLRIPYFMFMKEGSSDTGGETNKTGLALLTLLGTIILFLFFKPSLILDLL